MTPRYLYVHVPFCARRCSYCDFAVEAVREPPVAAWLDAIERELELVTEEHGWRRPQLDTVYVGGGTPSLIGASGMQALRRTLTRHADLAPDVEWTAEANPESFTAEVADGWRAAGVNRLSFGAQTFDPGVLRWMGRLHGPEGPGRAVATARAAGFEDVSIDLIFGVPARLRRDWAADLEGALALEPQHVSLYGLTAEEATPLGRWVREGRERMPGDERYEEEYLLAAERLPAAGFEHYEVSSFGLPGRRSRHNAAYWTGAAYLGLGPGAHSYVAPRRWWNERGWDAYRTTVAAGASPRAGAEVVDGDSALLERVWLGLRTADGLALGAEAGAPAVAELVARWRGAGLATPDSPTVRLTPRGWLLLDRLAVELAEALGPALGARAAPPARAPSAGEVLSDGGAAA